MGRITHIVLLSFKSSTSTEQANDTVNQMLALKDNCLHPTSKKPYIISASGGTDNSPEGLQGGITHAFVLQFENEEDRDYYVHKDPAHDDFKKKAVVLLEKVQAIDFTDGVFK